ncbi:hypothetical protein [Sodalis sp.]|uniref:hypothetical protein n=1 Tax=Sodalis sp. (in: enterobacteria) TaxID=1898979 RepID=UPI003872B188
MATATAVGYDRDNQRRAKRRLFRFLNALRSMLALIQLAEQLAQSGATFSFNDDETL